MVSETPLPELSSDWAFSSDSTFKTLLFEPFICKRLGGVVVPIPTFLPDVTTSPVPPTFSSEQKRLVEDAVVE